MLCPKCRMKMIDGYISIKNIDTLMTMISGSSWQDCVFTPIKERKNIKEYLVHQAHEQKTAFRCYKCGIVLVRDEDKIIY